MNDDDATSPRPAPGAGLLAWYAVAGGLLLANLAAFVRQNAVDLPFSDQLGLHELVWNHASLWTLFDFQYGPHRQGVFFPLTAWVLRATHGDIRCESVWIAAWLAAAAVLAFLLPRRLTGQWSAADILPAAWCLSLLNYETLTTTPNLSHSIGPLVLLLLAAHALLLRDPWRRGLSLAALTVALLFTGFGLFAAPWLTLYLAWTACRRQGREERWPAVVAAGLVGAGWILFLRDYRFDPASPGYVFPHHPLWDYARFLCRMVALRCGFGAPTPVAEIAGGAGIVAGAAALAWAAARCARQRDAPLPAVAALFLGTSLLYAANTAVGRVHMGVSAGMVSRYGALLVPLFLGLFLFVRSRPASLPGRLGLAVLFMAGLWPYHARAATGGKMGTWGLPREAWAEARAVRNGKLAWLWRYAQTHDVAEATHSAHFEIYIPGAYAPLAAKMARLQELEWGPFRHGKDPAGYEPFAGLPELIFVGLDGRPDEDPWLGREGWLLVQVGPPSWLNLPVVDRLALLPPGAPLRADLDGRQGDYGFVDASGGFSLPFAAHSSVVHLSSPAGTRQPSAAGGTADDRDLSFRLGRVTLDPAPRFPAWGPVGHRRWAPACALDRLDGFYGWEKGFGWMAGTLEATVETTGHAWINLRVGGRFAGLKGTAGLALSVDGVRRGTLLLRGESTAFSVEAAPAGRHVVQLRSEDGAVSPLAAGLGADARELSYRLLEIDVSAAPRFGPAPLRQPDPAGAPLCRH